MNFLSQIADKFVGKAPTLLNDFLQNAIVSRNKRHVEYAEKALPIISDAHDILLKITATTVCDPNFHLYSNEMLDMHDGDIRGYEFLEIIEQTRDQDLEPIGLVEARWRQTLGAK
ncbi:unnamed protein product [Adineta ricciae]|uniref:Uncharacterized protein n=1 Tax=Adineta ricciae TaxID=249248 RepID=A0A816FG55_ADIRI|nr:unnamed protein product [Adineta ricciae]